MKKVYVFILSAIALVGCGDDIEFNTPAIQGNKDGSLWRATYFNADIDNGALIIEGGRNLESIILLPNDDERGVYELGGTNSSEARYIDAQGVEYSTKYDPDPSVQLYPANGQIIIESFDTEANTVTGTFWFNAFTESGLGEVNFSQGHFYRVFMNGGLAVDPIISCDEAVAASEAALQTYNMTDTTSPDFPAVCNAYVTALTNQITSCGDDNDILQGIIDGLDCSDNTSPNCQTCTHATLPEAEYCDNNDGTIDVTIGGMTNTVDLMGVTFDQYILSLETSGYTCN